MAKRDYYEVLGVAKSATADEIKKAFHKQALKFHPDKNPGDKKAEDRFKELNEAYQTLSDVKNRQNYDQFGHFGAQAQGGFGGGNPFEGFAKGGARGAAGGPGGGAGDFSGQQGPENFQDLFGDIFNDFFTGRGGRPAGGAASEPRAATRNRGADLRYTLNISFEEAAAGAERTISFVRQRAGKEESAKLSITVPAGVKVGQRLKLKGEGDSPGNAAQAGDLYVVIGIQDHSLFKRVENDILLELPIAFLDALAGCAVEIPTLTGRATLKIPQGTTSGQSFRLKGKGFASVGGAAPGDMMVKVLVDVPAVNEEQLTELKRILVNAKPGANLKAYQEKVERILRKK
jgi:molecular chaperone DnaJ